MEIVIIIAAAGAVGGLIKSLVGVKVSTGSAAREGTGNYFYTYTIPASAVSGSTYTTKATVINSSDFVTIKRARFKVR
jgi:hypothetical protein